MARARLGIRTEESDEFSDVLKIIYKQKFCEENKDLLVFACTFLVDHVSSSNVQFNLFLQLGFTYFKDNSEKSPSY